MPQFYKGAPDYECPICYNASENCGCYRAEREIEQERKNNPLPAPHFLPVKKDKPATTGESNKELLERARLTNFLRK